MDVSGGLADSVLARIIRQRDLVRVMSEQCESLTARVSSRDGTVTVEVDGSGSMTGLWLTEGASHRGADLLSRHIVETADAAARVVQARQQILLREFTNRMAALQQSRLPRSDGG